MSFARKRNANVAATTYFNCAKAKQQQYDFNCAKAKRQQYDFNCAKAKRQQHDFNCAKAKRQQHDFNCAKAKRQQQQQHQQDDVGHSGVFTGFKVLSLSSSFSAGNLDTC
ncbi:hypothetical protein LAV72_13795 [Lysinibacillus xylanilyticus]|uniref:hypothetical protein n=1 Tax=Lysinibacillus xylanilyticus TaxID=582475 RepID=UPI002B24711A|nr:hypothetical protein [Lysinibacillus xylanilyticus]MEB2300690.1 hypothetical protein [Lysinibacillus xylanilyticus]